MFPKVFQMKINVFGIHSEDFISKKWLKIRVFVVFLNQPNEGKCVFA